MPRSWKEDFFEKLVEASRATGDARLATAALHRRKKTASFHHPQLNWLECVFDANRISGNQDSQVLVVECAPKRGSEIDGQSLKCEFKAAVNGEMQIDSAAVFFQCVWGYGGDAGFPVHDPRRVEELICWTLSVVKVLFDHLERRRKIVRPAASLNGEQSTASDFMVTLEEYLEDLIVAQWDSLLWTADFEYLGRQVPCADLGKADILARHRHTGDFVVIELKRDQADDEVVGQLSRYMGWVNENRAAPACVGVRGIIVAHELTSRLRAAASAHPNMELYTYKLTVDICPVSLPGRPIAG